MPNDYEKMLEMQQQQQQMMYNYYNNPYANRMQQQQLNVQGFQQQGFNTANMQNMSMQNKQNLQGNSQYNVNMMGNQNAYINPQQMNMSNYSQNGNFTNQQGQMQGIQGMGQMSSMPQLPNNVSFSQLPPLVQKQFLQMYQMAQMKQANQGFTGQVAGNNLQGNQNYSMYQTQQANMGGNSPYFNTNEGASPGISSQMSSMNTLGFPTSPGFPAGNQISSKGQIEDDFADFQTANNSSKQAEKDPFAEFSAGFGQQSHQGNFNKNNAEDDFDDFQDAVQAKVADEDEFDDFKDANNTSNQNKEPEGEKNWDILDDFVEKKELTQPQIPQTTQTQQQAMHMQQNVPVNQQIYQQNAGNMQMQGMNYQGMHLGHQQGIGYPGNVNMFGQGFGPTSGNSGTENKEDDFADFEEAKPTQIQLKTSAKEDILFGALEKKLKKEMLHEPENEQEKDYDFGEFEETKPQGNIWEMNFGGETQQAVDDFEDFEQAGVENQQTTTQQNNPPPQDGKKLTIYDIDLTGIFFVIIFFRLLINVRIWYNRDCTGIEDDRSA